MPYLAAIATEEWCFKEERVLNTMLLEFCTLYEIISSAIRSQKRCAGHWSLYCKPIRQMELAAKSRGGA